MSPQERAQLAESQMLGDESLTANLNDSEAERLLNWAVIRARRLAMKTATMNQLDGDSYFAMTTPMLQRVIRKINKIGGSLPNGLAESILPDLQVIFESANHLPELLAIPERDMAEFAAELARLSPSEAVNKLTNILTLRE